MSLLIRDYEVSFDSSNIPRGPGQLEHVRAIPSISPLYVYNGTRWLLDQPGGRSAVPDYDDGYFTLRLPWLSESDPDTVTWEVVRANGLVYSGTVPEGVTGPVSLLDLVQLYGWTVGILVTLTPTAVTSVAVSAPGEFTVEGSPIRSSGTLALSWVPEPANLLLAGPTSGTAAPSFRALDSSDLPLATTGTPGAIQVGSGLSITGGVLSTAIDGPVTSVALSAPLELTVTGSPLTDSGTLALTWTNEDANQIFAGPTAGGSDTPGFRFLDPSDIPNLDAAILTSGILDLARGGTGLDSSAASNGSLLIGTGSGLSLATLTAGSNISITNLSGNIVIGSTDPGGTVTSIALTAPSELSVSGSPITNSGTLDLSWASQTQNYVFGAPSGSSGTPGFRALVTGDIPNLDASKITTGILGTARGGTGVDSSGASNGSLLIGTGSGLSLAALTAGANITITNASGGITIASSNPGGTVTSVALSLPAEFNISGSPITGAGTLTVTRATQSPNLVMAGPSSGIAATPTFRSLVAADIPNLDGSKITGGTLTLARGGTAVDNTGISANRVFIGPTSGGAGNASFRALVAADIPAVPTSSLGNIVIPLSIAGPQGGGFDTAGSSTTVGTPTAFMATSGGTSFLDITTNLNNATGATLNFGATNDAVYLGSSTGATSIWYWWRYTSAASPSFNLNLQWEYYNGTSWTTFPSSSAFQDNTVVSAGSQPFSRISGSQGIVFLPPSDWATVSVHGTTAYWVRCRCTSFTSSTTSPKVSLAVMARFADAVASQQTIPFNGTITSIHNLNVLSNGFYNITTGVFTGLVYAGNKTLTTSISVAQGDSYLCYTGATNNSTPNVANVLAYLTPS